MLDPISMPLFTSTGPVQGRSWQHLPRTGPVLAHTGMFIGEVRFDVLQHREATGLKWSFYKIKKSFLGCTVEETNILKNEYFYENSFVGNLSGCPQN